MSGVERLKGAWRPQDRRFLIDTRLDIQRIITEVTGWPRATIRQRRFRDTALRPDSSENYRRRRIIIAGLRQAGLFYAEIGDITGGRKSPAIRWALRSFELRASDADRALAAKIAAALLDAYPEYCRVFPDGWRGGGHTFS